MKNSFLLLSITIFPMLFIAHDVNLDLHFNSIIEENVNIVISNIEEEKNWSYGIDSCLTLICLEGCRSDLQLVSETYSFRLRMKEKYALRDCYPQVEIDY